MAIIKISELPAATSPVSPSDVLPTLQNGVTKKAAIDQFGFLPAGQGAVTRTIQDKLRENINVKDFGAIGNGVADDTAAIQAAINAAGASTNSVYFSPGVYKVTTPVNITQNNITIRGDNAEIMLRTAPFDAAFQISGSLGSVMPVQGSINQYATSFQLLAGDAATLSPGDFVRIFTTENYFDVVDRDYKKGEIVKVVSVSGTTVNVEPLGFYLSYSSGSGTITARKLNLIENVFFDGIKISGTGGAGAAGRQVGINGHCVRNLRVENCEIEKVESGVVFDSSIECTINDCFLHDIYQDVGYGITASGASQNILVSNCQFENNRHSFTTGGEVGVCMFITVTGNTVNNHTTVDGAIPLNTHGNCRFVEFSNNTVSNALSGIALYSPCSRVINNSVYNSEVSGIATYEAGGVNVEISGNLIVKASQLFFSAIDVGNDATSAETNEYVIVTNNVVRECDNGDGIYITNGNLTTPISSVQVTGNVVDKYGYVGIQVLDAANVSVTDNIVTRGLRPAQYGIRIVNEASTPTWSLGTNAVVTNNNLNDSYYGIKVEESDNLVLQGNLVNNITAGYQYTLTNVTTVQGTDVLRSPNGTLYRLAVDNSGNVSGVSI